VCAHVGAKNLGDAGPRPLRWGCALPLWNTPLQPFFTVPNLVILGQSIPV